MSKNLDLNKNATKQKILNYIAEKVSSKDIPVNINNNADLDKIKKENYIICPKSEGIRSWLVFIKFGKCYYAVNFPKYRMYDINKLNIFPVEITADPVVYNGTIMEGIYNVINGVKTFIIDDMYYFSGKMEIPKMKDDRLFNSIDLIRDYFGGNPNFKIYVSHYFSINKDSLGSLYNKIKNDPMINEIIFYPKLYGGKIYKYSITNNDLIDKVIKIMIFNMKKTKKTEIYDLIDTKTNNKIDIAMIPDLQTSKMCKRWFMINKTDTLLVKCKFAFDKNKWIPVELIS